MTQNKTVRSERYKALLSLALLVPIPSIGVLAGMVWLPDTVLGKTVFALSKAWLWGFPLVWHLWIDRGKPSLSPPCKGGFGVGILSGVLISAVILAAYFLLGDFFLDKAMLQEKIKAIGLTSITVYTLGALYWICVNSVLEEYVWRWFVVSQAGRLVRPRWAVLIAAVCFTLHHVIALKTMMPWTATLVCSAGVFLGGALWSWIYVKYESIWPGYVSHAIVDVCVFGIGAMIVLG